MRVSRAPEHRGGAGSPILLILVLLVVLIVGGVVIYLLLGNNPAAAPVAPPAQATAPGNPEPFPTIPQRSNPAPQLQPTQAPVSPQETNSFGGDTPRFKPPEVIFGVVVHEGFVDLELLNGRVRAWYTLRLDTSTQTPALFFAFFDPEGKTISRNVFVEDYTEGGLIDNAEVTVFYPGAPDRVLNFDREAGTITSQQFYTTQPYGPSLFSPQTRISMIKQDLALQNGEGDIQAESQVDLTGVSDREGFTLLQYDPVAAGNALDEIQEIIDQLESRRERSR